MIHTSIKTVLWPSIVLFAIIAEHSVTSAADWVQIGSVQGTFEVSFPGRPCLVIKNAKNCDYIYEDGKPKTTYSAGWFEIGKQIVDMFVKQKGSQWIKLVIQEAAKYTSAQIINESNLQIQGHPAYEVESLRSQDGASYRLLLRAIAIEGRLYCVSILMPEDRFDREQCVKFFDSFVPGIIPKKSSLPEWLTVKSCEGRFEAEFPGEPSYRKEDNSIFVRFTKPEGESFRVACSDGYFPPSLPEYPQASEFIQKEQFIDVIRDASLKSMAAFLARLTEEKRSTSNGNPARHITYTFQRDGRTFVANIKCFYDGDRLYASETWTCTVNGKIPNEKDRQKFVDSIKIWKGD